ncbi:MAG: hypothetical protein WDO13_21965 [Verrucomicrobiota bacterium]
MHCHAIPGNAARRGRPGRGTPYHGFPGAQKRSRVCAGTLAKIRALAAEMGYMPDPMLSALNAYRHASRPSQFHGTVAWVTNFTTRDGWRERWGLNRTPCYELYFQGAAQQLERHGYKLEEYWLQEPGLTARRSATCCCTAASAAAALPPADQPRPPEPGLGEIFRGVVRLLAAASAGASVLRGAFSRDHHVHAQAARPRLPAHRHGNVQRHG